MLFTNELTAVPPLSLSFLSSLSFLILIFSFFLFDSISLFISIFNILEAVSDISDSLSFINFFIKSFNDLGILFKSTFSSF